MNVINLWSIKCKSFKSFRKTFLFFLVIGFTFCTDLTVYAQQNSKIYGNPTKNLRVDIYEDNEQIYSFFYNKNLVQEIVSYNTQTKKPECITKYHYKKNGQLNRIRTAKGSAAICKDISEISKKLAADYQVQLEFLKSKNIVFPFPELFGDEISDISSVLSVMDNYNELKKEIEVNGNQSTIGFSGLNKSIRFYPSSITLFIENNSLIKDYELILKDGYPQSEFYRTDKGELTRKYLYDAERRITKILSDFKGVEYVKTSSETRIEYYKL